MPHIVNFWPNNSLLFCCRTHGACREGQPCVLWSQPLQVKHVLLFTRIVVHDAHRTSVKWFLVILYTTLWRQGSMEVMRTSGLLPDSSAYNHRKPDHSRRSYLRISVHLLRGPAIVFVALFTIASGPTCGQAAAHNMTGFGEYYVASGRHLLATYCSDVPNFTPLVSRHQVFSNMGDQQSFAYARDQTCYWCMGMFPKTLFW